jgi:hypothetical protein
VERCHIRIHLDNPDLIQLSNIVCSETTGTRSNYMLYRITACQHGWWPDLELIFPRWANAPLLLLRVVMVFGEFSN